MAALTPRFRLLALAYARGFALVHGGAVLVVGIALAAESADEPWGVLVARLVADLPHTWALLAPPLCLAGGGIALSRLRSTGQLTALGSLGVGVNMVIAAALVAGLLAGAVCAAVGVTSSPAVEVTRVEGGWWLRGEFVPDLLGVSPTPAASGVGRWLATAWLCTLAAWAGASVGAWRNLGRVLVLSAGVLCLDLVQRGLPLAYGPPVGVGAALAAVCVQWANRWGRRWPD